MGSLPSSLAILSVLLLICSSGVAIADSTDTHYQGTGTVPAAVSPTQPGRYQWSEEAGEGDEVQWTWSSFQRLSFRVIDPAGKVLDESENVTIGNGRVIAPRDGLYRFLWLNHDIDQEVQVTYTLDIEWQLTDLEVVAGLIGCIIAPIVVAVVVLWWIFRRRARRQVQEARREASVPPYMRPPEWESKAGSGTSDGDVPDYLKPPDFK